MRSWCPPLSAVIWALALASVACDEPRGPATAPPPASPDERTDEPEAEAPEPEPKPEPEPEPPAGPSCDRRGSGAEGLASATCIDYGQHRGALEPRCAEGLTLAEVGCPRDEIVAHCTLPATGVRLFYYAGAELDAAASECETLDGAYASGAPSSADPS